MKKLLSIFLVAVLCLALCSCGAQEQVEFLEQKNHELESQAAQLEQTVQTLTKERDELRQQLTSVQEDLRASEEALKGAQTDVAAMQENMKALEEEVQELKYPPLKLNGTIRLFGVDADVFTDGTFEYVLFEKFNACSGLNVSKEEVYTR